MKKVIEVNYRNFFFFLLKFMVKIFISGNCYGKLVMKIKLFLNILKLLIRILLKRYEDGNKYGYFL